MNISLQPMSAFAVYSEKLKQKKKKSKPQVTNGVAKLKKSNGGKKLLKKSQVSNSTKKLKKPIISSKVKKSFKDVNDKKTRQMQEIRYILQILADKSADTSSPRATGLSNSISEANEKLDHNDSTYIEDVFKNVIMVENLKKKKRSLNNVNRKEGSKAVVESVKLDNDLNTKHSKLENTSIFDHLSDGGKNCAPAESSKTTFLPSGGFLFEANKLKVTKLKKKRTLSKEEEAVGLNSKAGHTKKNKLKFSSEETLIKRKCNDQLDIMSKKKGKKNPPKDHEYNNSTSKQLFEWLIVPVTEKDFMSDFWEKKPLLIQRERNRNHYSELLSTETIDAMLRENNVCFTKHLDVTSYTDGIRETHNMTGRAQANVVWDFYSNGCSIRLLNPQVFLPKIHILNSTLQEYFGCFVGANVYLTPPNSQGFAPHYDDIEAFVLQVEGKKHWRVYTPRTDTEVLPRFSSPNFSQEEIGEPVLDVTLEPGDLLYFPRGFIHQASTVEGEHSLHITLSAYQKTAWVDLFEKVLPIALKRAAENDVDFRRGLPRDYLGLEYCGTSREKQSFVNTAETLMEKLGHYLQLSLGAGVDQMGAQFMHDALPPVLTPSEKQNTSVGGGLKLKNGKLEGRVEFLTDTCIKLTRYNICRLVEEENEVRLYHCLENSLEYHGEEPQFLVLPPEGVQVITHLQTCYPKFAPIGAIPHEDQESLLTLISDLWDAGLLSAKELPVVEES